MAAQLLLRPTLQTGYTNLHKLLINLNSPGGIISAYIIRAERLRESSARIIPQPSCWEIRRK